MYWYGLCKQNDFEHFCNNPDVSSSIGQQVSETASARSPTSHMKSSGNFHCKARNSVRRHDSRNVGALKLDFCPISMTKSGCKQNVESTGMACQGRARNRMLRKRWVVRNPVVGEDDVTQSLLPQSFTIPWPYEPCSCCYRHSTNLLFKKQTKNNSFYWDKQLNVVSMRLLFVAFQRKYKLSDDAALFKFPLSIIILLRHTHLSSRNSNLAL